MCVCVFMCVCFVSSNFYSKYTNLQYPKEVYIIHSNHVFICSKVPVKIIVSLVDQIEHTLPSCAFEYVSFGSVVNLAVICFKSLSSFLSHYLGRFSLCQTPVSLWKLFTFISPLMLVMLVQRLSRPFINFMVARFSSSSAEADEVDKRVGCQFWQIMKICECIQALAVLTATYPIGHLPYGWLNQIRSVSPAFQKKVLLGIQTWLLFVMVP